MGTWLDSAKASGVITMSEFYRLESCLAQVI
jgi:hypothetical protein